jgi:hypothetical protein
VGHGVHAALVMAKKSMMTSCLGERGLREGEPWKKSRYRSTRFTFP